jgi:hypothetical protein
MLERVGEYYRTMSYFIGNYLYFMVYCFYHKDDAVNLRGRFRGMQPEEGAPAQTMISYDTTMMHSTAKTIQDNGTTLQSDIQSFWNSYQSAQDGTPSALTQCLSGFMNNCKPALDILVKNRSALGSKLDQAATAVEQEEARLKNSFRPGGGHIRAE